MTDTLAAVMRDEIRLDRLPETTPSAVRRLIARCLERDPKRRLRDIGDSRMVLDDAVTEPANAAAAARRHRVVAGDDDVASGAMDRRGRRSRGCRICRPPDIAALEMTSNADRFIALEYPPRCRPDVPGADELARAARAGWE